MAENESTHDRADDVQEESNRRFLLFNAVPSWLVSTLFHVVLLLVLALIMLPHATDPSETALTVDPSAVEVVEELPPSPPDFPPPVPLPKPTPIPDAPDDPMPLPKMANVAASFAMDTPVSVDLPPLGVDGPTAASLILPGGAAVLSGYDGRNPNARGKFALENGGNEQSERAVADALRWLAAHQVSDGGWTLQHDKVHQCSGRCRHPGSKANSRNGATGLALLAFLGAGQTHVKGSYKEQVRAGLDYLLTHGKIKGNTFSFHDGGNMYSHGLCAIALCEAYALTHDKRLLAPAQMSLNFITAAQDPVGGGWRYTEKQPGDTSVVGWQLIALKSGHMAYLQVSPQTIKGASKFLDSVQTDSGAQYGYTGPSAKHAMTSVGLLCRMYLGWKHDDPALQRGVAVLDKKGKSETDMYYNYYATQVMRHYEGEEWERWNAGMRDWLIGKQATSGHEKGSWMMNGGHANQAGGRLYCTAMAAMTLEVYYRIMPVFGKQAAEDDFPL